MKKWILFFTSFIALVVVSFALYLFINRINFAESGLTRIFGVPTHITGLSWSKTSLRITGITIDNPPNYSANPSFKCEELIVKLPFSEQLALLTGYRPVKIKKIYLHHPYFCIEQKITTDPSNNWQELLQHALDHEEKRPGRTFTAKDIVLQHVKALFIKEGSESLMSYPETNDIIVMGQVTGAKPVSLDRMISVIAKVSLMQLGADEEHKMLSETWSKIALAL